MSQRTLSRAPRETDFQSHLLRIRAKSWIGTLNNFTSADHAILQDLLISWTSAEYCVWQEEVGESGTPHLQIFLHLSKPESLTQLKRMTFSTAHWERAKQPQKAMEYCQKEDTRINGPWIIGVIPMFQQGKRSDLSIEIEKIADGKLHPESKEFADLFPKGVVLRSKGLTKLWNQLHERNRTTNPIVMILYGVSGVGKSYRALKMDTPPNTYWSWDGKWMDGYRGQRTLIMNEFTPVSWGEMSWNEWKRITDWTPLRRHTKGSSVNYSPSLIILTTNEHPSMWWQEERQRPFEQGVWENRDIHEFHIEEKEKDPEGYKELKEKIENLFN